MKKQLANCLAFIMLISFLSPAYGQIWPFRGGSSAARATRDLEKRQREVSQGNLFNPLQPMGSARNSQRDDHIWPASSAHLNNINSGNISIVKTSRLGISPKTELQAHLGAMRWIPNLGIKHRFHSGKWMLASRHGLYSPSPGLRWARDQGYQFIIDSTATIPAILAARNEVIASKPFHDNSSCGTVPPFLVLTAAISVDNSLFLTSNRLKIIERHFWGPRSTLLTGNNILVSARARVDARINSRSWLQGEVKILSPGLERVTAVEHHAAINYFLLHNTTVSAGYIFSAANFGGSRVSIKPWVDVSWYFGQKKRPARGLFRQEMF